MHIIFYPNTLFPLLFLHKYDITERRLNVASSCFPLSERALPCRYRKSDQTKKNQSMLLWESWPPPLTAAPNCMVSLSISLGTN